MENVALKPETQGTSLLTLADVRAAAERISGQIGRAHV